MKLKLITTLVLGFSGIFFSQLKSQTTFIDIIRWDNVEKKVELNSLDKFTFTTDDLVLNYLTGVVENLPKSEIRKLVFGTSTAINQAFSVNAILIYPNPARDFITIKNLSDTRSNVIVYSITGSQVLNLKVNAANQQFDISMLPKGLYYLKANNQVAKFTKQ